MSDGAQKPRTSGRGAVTPSQKPQDGGAAFFVPSGCKEVPRADFYRLVGQGDIVPRTQRDYVIWETRDRRVVGYSTPGYMASGKKAYYLLEASA